MAEYMWNGLQNHGAAGTSGAVGTCVQMVNHGAAGTPVQMDRETHIEVAEGMTTRSRSRNTKTKVDAVMSSGTRKMETEVNAVMSSGTRKSRSYAVISCGTRKSRSRGMSTI
jgi:hypothetical protein